MSNYPIRPPNNKEIEIINNLLAVAMDEATENGADSRSMPDEYVLLAMWLCGLEK